MKRFESEMELTNIAINHGVIDLIAENFYGFNFCQAEPFNLFGIPDYIAANVPENSEEPIFTLALEFKLYNWRRALEQAFRYRSFADVAYVLLDDARASQAIFHIHKFTRSNIGLITVDRAGIFTVHHTPIPEVPYQDYLMLKSHNFIRQSFENSRSADF